ncbi:Site-specific recombinase XerC [Paracoccus halophilus]|uniref:Site-specific recombinase XerC n=1 Tax=Paracoccus halophilus TaxID=376733 RepID=A0A1I0U5T5_9RHOB|nr:Site-specific recombinase XerC [Paracoccus halophilus]
MWTDSEREARIKAVVVEAEIMAHWEALAAGQAGDAAAAYDAARQLAKSRDFPYRPASELARGPIDDLLRRIEMVASAKGGVERQTEEIALLGGIDQPLVTISMALEEFFRFSEVERQAGKSERQIKRWRQPRQRAVSTFIQLNGDLPMSEIRRDHAQRLRDHWAERIAREGLDKGSANKDIGHLSDLFRSWFEYHALDLPNPFARLRFRGKKTGTVGVAFSEAFIRERILGSGALDGLNEEARDVLLVMVNTGARPSEILGCSTEAWQLTGPVPHIDISKQIPRVLKTAQSPRQIPLLGVSLDAAKRIVDRGGITHYLDKGDNWSATVNKYLTRNNLRETPKHAAYSLRHSFEDRMVEAAIDDRIRAELMGHKYARPDYGRGGSLEIRRKALERIAL